MIYPVQMYGSAVLRKKASDVERGSIDLKTWSKDMFETMHAAQGVGLAAPQIGRSIRIFVVDGNLLEGLGAGSALKKIFINPEITARDGQFSEREEGCLSIPGIREKIARPETIKIKFFDSDWTLHEEKYTGLYARVIQHEYDHLEGILFIDYLPSLKKRLLKRKLNQISKGDVEVDYAISSPLRQ